MRGVEDRRLEVHADAPEQNEGAAQLGLGGPVLLQHLQHVGAEALGDPRLLLDPVAAVGLEAPEHRLAGRHGLGRAVHLHEGLNPVELEALRRERGPDDGKVAIAQHRRRGPGHALLGVRLVGAAGDRQLERSRRRRPGGDRRDHRRGPASGELERRGRRQHAFGHAMRDHGARELTLGR